MEAGKERLTRDAAREALGEGAPPIDLMDGYNTTNLRLETLSLFLLTLRIIAAYYPDS